MELTRTGKTTYQIEYRGIGISKISIHETAKSAEDELRLFKKQIKKEELKEIMKNIKVYEIQELQIINLGKNIKED